MYISLPQLGPMEGKDSPSLLPWIQWEAYNAITVVTGLTTVYWRTPSLHLNSSTLVEKDSQTRKHPSIHISTMKWLCICRPLTLPWAMAGSSTAGAGVAAAAGPPAWAPGSGTGYWGSSTGTPGSCRWRRPRSTLCTCPHRWPGWDTAEPATARDGGVESRKRVVDMIWQKRKDKKTNKQKNSTVFRDFVMPTFRMCHIRKEEERKYVFLSWPLVLWHSPIPSN